MASALALSTAPRKSLTGLAPASPVGLRPVALLCEAGGAPPRLALHPSRVGRADLQYTSPKSVAAGYQLPGSCTQSSPPAWRRPAFFAPTRFLSSTRRRWDERVGFVS